MKVRYAVEIPISLISKGQECFKRPKGENLQEKYYITQQIQWHIIQGHQKQESMVCRINPPLKNQRELQQGVQSQNLLNSAVPLMENGKNKSSLDILKTATLGKEGMPPWIDPG